MKFVNSARWKIKRKPKTVFVLSGGAVRGAAQIGMLNVILSSGIKPDEVVGVSVGALNGFWLASSPSIERIQKMEKLWIEVASEPPIRGNVLRTLTSILRGRPSFDTGERLKKILQNNLPILNLEETEIPFHLGTTNASNGLMTWWERGVALDLLCASAAIPGLLPAIQLEDGDYHLDGGVVSNIPLRKAVSLKPTRMIVFDVATGFLPPEKQTALSLMMVGFRAASAELTRQEWLDVPKNIEVLHIELPSPDAPLDIDFNGVPDLIKEGEKAAKAVLSESYNNVAR